MFPKGRTEDLEDDLSGIELPGAAATALDYFFTRYNFLGDTGDNDRLDSVALDGSRLPSSPPVMSGVMMTVNEETAVRCLLEENGVEIQSAVSQLSTSLWESWTFVD